jgi:eukaryotic-like serine/threonine-protein kinase
VRGDEVLGGRYQLKNRLGAGGMSVVWEAWDLVLERAVAVKVLAGTHATEPLARERIQAEARAAARLWHPRVTSVYDYGECADAAGHRLSYVVMELLPGQTLSRRLAVGPLPPALALRTSAQVAEALAAAHEQNLVHRDIKPSNVMLTPAGVKVVDFGIAAAVGRSELEADGRLLGTAAYLAPERVTGGTVLPASDIYALGLLLYRALTNELPWSAETPTQMLRAHVYVDPAPLPPIEGVSAEVHRFIDRCLARDPAARPSAEAAAATLRDLADAADRAPAAALPAPAVASAADPGAGARSEPRRRGRRRILLLPVVLAAGTTVGVTALLLPHWSPIGGGDRTLKPENAPPAAAPVATTTGKPATAPGARPTPPAPRRSGSATPRPRPATTTPGTTAPGTAPGEAPPPTRTRTPSAPAPAPAGSVLTARGGTVTVRCEGKQVRVVDLAPAAGYEIKDYDPGPAGEIQVVLLSARNESEVKATCVRGKPVPRIKESPQ